MLFSANDFAFTGEIGVAGAGVAGGLSSSADDGVAIVRFFFLGRYRAFSFVSYVYNKSVYFTLLFD